MRRLLRFVIALGLAIAVPRAAGAADGDLDTTFAGGSGVLRVPYSVNLTRYTTAANALAIQNDGRIVASWVLAPCCAFGGFYRSLADGSGPDSGFGFSGFAFLTGSYSSQTRAKLDANQHLVVSGNCHANGDFGHPCLWRLDASGFPDSNFGTGGVVELPTTTHDTAPFDVVVDFDFAADGSIYAIVDAYQAQLPYAFATLGVLFKIDASGNIVGAGNGAPIGVPTGFQLGLLRRIIVRDNLLTIGAMAYSNTSSSYDVLVMRFDGNGSIDNGFGSSGVATFGFDIGGMDKDDLSAMLIQPDGKLLLGGTATDGAQTPQVRMGLARMRSDGSGLDGGDPGFGAPSGKFTFTAYYDGNTGDRSQDTLTDLALQSDLKIVVVGWSDKSNVPGANPNADNLSSAVFRFDPYGVDDATFNAGVHNLALGFMSDSARVDHSLAVGLQGGRIVLGGYAGAGVDASDIDLVVARLQSDLILTNGFDLEPAPPPF